MHCETLLQLLDNAGLENGKRKSSDKDMTAHMLSCPRCSSRDVVSPLVDALRAVNEQMRRDPQSGTSNAVMSGSPGDDGSDKGSKADVLSPSPVAPASPTPNSHVSIANTPTSALKNDEPVPAASQGIASEPSPVPLDQHRSPKKTKQLIPDNNIPTMQSRTNLKQQPKT